MGELYDLIKVKMVSLVKDAIAMMVTKKGGVCVYRVFDVLVLKDVLKELVTDFQVIENTVSDYIYVNLKAFLIIQRYVEE